MNREEIYKRCCHLQNEIMLFELDKKSQMEVVVFNSIFSCSRCKKICMHKSKKRNSQKSSSKHRQESSRIIRSWTPIRPNVSLKLEKGRTTRHKTKTP